MQGFDRLASVYDTLGRLVFGQNLEKAHSCFFGELASCKRVLILGGGTGYYLKALHQNCKEAEVFFHESSSEMIKRAKSNAPEGMSIVFDESDSLDSISGSFDAVVSCFYWDLFEGDELVQRVKQLKAMTAPGALVCLSDFDVRIGSKPQMALVRIMYFFFRLTTGLKTRSLSDYWAVFAREGFTQVKSKSYFFGWINASLLKSPNT